jgi:hypothetical protein
MTGATATGAAFTGAVTTDVEVVVATTATIEVVVAVVWRAGATPTLRAGAVPDLGVDARAVESPPEELSAQPNPTRRVAATAVIFHRRWLRTRTG